MKSCYPYEKFHQKMQEYVKKLTQNLCIFLWLQVLAVEKYFHVIYSDLLL